MISHDSLDRADFRVSYSQYEAFGRLSGIELCWYFPTFCFFKEGNETMSYEKIICPQCLQEFWVKVTVRIEK